MNDVKNTNKPVYPSQVNTKTISCRISAQDYVTFLNEAVTNGITLNDWLLMKIYSNNIGSIPSSSLTPLTNDIYKQIKDKLDDYGANDNSGEYEWEAQKNGINPRSPEGILFLIDYFKGHIDYIIEAHSKAGVKWMNEAETYKTPNINNIKAQILTIAQDKFDNQKELRLFMSDVSELLEEIA